MVPGTPDVPSEYEPYGRERCCGLNPASVEEPAHLPRGSLGRH